MQDVTIRPAAPPDLPALLALIEAMTRHHDDEPGVTAAGLARDFFGPEPWFRGLVAAQAGQLIGYAALLPLARLGYGQRGLDLHHLFVAQGQRGRGIGTALIAASLDLARDLECDYMIIGTHPENFAAQGFYQSLGFERMPTTAVRFTRSLK
jgi:GNAT superfamily N-acetyltransferase